MSSSMSKVPMVPMGVSGGDGVICDVGGGGGGLGDDLGAELGAGDALGGAAVGLAGGLYLGALGILDF